MQAVTLLLVSAAMSGGGEWPDEDYSNRRSTQVQATQAPRGVLPPSNQPSALYPAATTTTPAVYGSDFDAGNPSNRGPATDDRRRRQRTVTPTEFTLPDLSAALPPQEHSSNSGQAPQGDRPIVPPPMDRGRANTSDGRHDSQDFLSAQASDEANSQQKRTYIPPSQSMSSASQFASPPVTNPPTQFTREQATAPQYTPASQYAPQYTTTQSNASDPRFADQRTSPQYAQPGQGTYSPQYQGSSYARRPQEPIYSAQNPPPNGRSNPIESVSNTVESAAQATRQTFGDGARRVGAALDAGAQSVVRESERHGSSQFLTLLTLFGSIGLNLYLGWIAWDTYNRYQDLVADIRYTGSRRGPDYEGPHEGKAALAELA